MIHRPSVALLYLPSISTPLVLLIAFAVLFPKMPPFQHAVFPLNSCGADSLLKLMRLFMSTPVCSVQITKGQSKLLKCHTFFFAMLDFSTVP